MYEDIKDDTVLEITKIFDIHIKNQKQINSVFIDENNFLKHLFFLSSDKKIYKLNIITKKLEEFYFSKNHKVILITGNCNNKYILIIFKSCKIYAINPEFNSIYYFKNLQSVPLNINQEGEENIFSPKLNLFVNDNLNKAVLYTGKEIIIWYKHQMKYNPKKKLNELIGHHRYIQLQEDKKSFIKDNNKYYEQIICVFNNDIFQGSSINIYYFMIFRIENTNLFKLVIINYIFMFNNENIFNSIDSNDIKEKYLINNEINNKFSSKYSFTYIINLYEHEKIIKNKNIINIISRKNKNGNMIILGINFDNYLDNILILFFPKTYKIFSSLLSKIFPVKKLKTIIQDMSFIMDDYLIIIYFINGYFALLNTEFKIIKFFDSFNNFSLLENTNNIYIFNTFLSMNLCKDNNNYKEGDTYFKLLTNKNISNINDNEHENNKLYEYLIVYTNSKIIGFHINNKDLFYVDRLLNDEVKNFDEVKYLIQFIQINDFDENKKGYLFDKIHNYFVLNFGQIFQSLRAVINPLPTEQDYDSNKIYDSLVYQDIEQANLINNFFVKFTYLFRNLNLTKHHPLSLTSYFIVLTNDFFQYLLKQKDVWLAFLLVELGEKYILNKLKLRNYKNNSNDAEYIRGETSFLLFNPNILEQSSVKGYNTINNFSLFSKLRLLIIFFCLMEFRNNQARNINVLYFVLAKLVINKLKKENALDDVNFMIKVIIRNWKYLKSENMKSTEEYVLNSFSINYKAETLGLLLHTNSFISSNYIGRKTLSKTGGHIDSLTTIRNTKSRFDFFNDFYSLDEFSNFNNLIINFTSGQENVLLREFSYYNHLGVIQKWMIYLCNFLHSELFKDYKQYINTYLKQNITQKKPENISQEEKNLNKMIVFNLYTFMNILILFNKDIFKYIINLRNTKNKLFCFVLPSDLPFLISEFYAIVYDLFEKTFNSKNILLKDINKIFNKLWSRYKKEIVYDINNAFDLCNFLMQNGFKYYLNNEQIYYNINEYNKINEENKIMNLIFSLLEFSIIIIHKIDILNEIDIKNEDNFIFDIIKILPDKDKKNIYELCFVVFIGHIRDYIYRQIGGGKNDILTTQQEYNFSICINFLKILFIKYISEENPLVYENMNEVVQILPDFMKIIFLEEGMEHLFNIFEKNFIKDILDNNNILDLKNFLLLNNHKKESKFIENQKISKIFYDTIFKDKKDKYTLFNILLMNFVNMIFNGNKNFEIEMETDINKILSIMKNNVNENFFDELIKGKIDEFKSLYKDSIYIDKLIKKIKITFIKICHLLSILYLKYKLLLFDYKKNQLEIIQLYVLLLLLVENNFKYSEKIGELCTTLKYIINNNNTEQSHKNIVEILININLGFIFKQIEPNNNFKELEKFIGEKHKNLMDLYSFSISNNISIFSKLKGKFKQEQNKFILFFSNNNYVLLLKEIYQIFISQSNNAINKDKEPFKEQREIYKILLEKFYNLTGFNVNMKIEFEEDWELIINNPIYNLIISDKFTGRKFFNKDIFDSLLSDDIKNDNLEMPNFTKNKEKRNIENIIESKNINLAKKEKEEIKCYKIKIKNKNSQKMNIINSMINKQNKFEIFSILIKKLILNKFKNQLFMCFKKRDEIINLEKLEFIKYDTINNSTESYIIKEKYVLNEENNNKIKPFTLVKINKFKPGDSSKSKFFNELLLKKNMSHLGSKIQEKLKDIQNKIKEFEDFNILMQQNFFNNNAIHK